MTFDPQDFAIPAGFKHYEGDGAEDNLGPHPMNHWQPAVQQDLRKFELLR